MTMSQYLFERRIRVNRRRAVVFTILFHAALIGGLLAASDGQWRDHLPETVKEWLGWDKPADMQPAQASVPTP
ncbi:MAG: hypothetical protein H6562_07545 [Lewinellaceae bacterium]|nr:hypothetical protein [Lewinellaceae bacterium]